MPSVIFAAPQLSENASRMVEAAVSLPDVRLGVITHDPVERLEPPLRSKIAAHWRVENVLDKAQLVDAARSLSSKLGPIHRFFGAYEQLQVPLAEAREELGIAGMRKEAVNNFRDKSRMKDVFRAHDIPCARHKLVTNEMEAISFASEVGYPLVVKPPAGAGAQSTFRVEGDDELRNAVRAGAPQAGRPLLLEEFITGDEHSFETISINGNPVWHSLTHYRPTPLDVLRNPWIQWCVVLPREVDAPAYDDIRIAARRAIQVLGMDTGLTHMEWFRRRDGSIAISEVAARPPGAQITSLMSVAHGIDMVKAWARVMIFGEFEPPERRYSVGVAFLRGQGGGEGGGRVKAIHGLDLIQREMGALVVDAKLPTIGQSPAAGYEGEGWVILRHPETEVVEKALLRLISVVRVELG
ncbi:MAG: acetyl-CoA carboxylase biotin carboxylase subunit family protein [Gemmatimonadaceae bacterium]